MTLDWAQLRQAYIQARRRFLAYDGVIGIGYGPHRSENGELDKWALIVLVDHNQSPDLTSKDGSSIPSNLNGFPIVVREFRSESDHEKVTEDLDFHSDSMMIDRSKVHNLHMASLNQTGLPTCQELQTAQVGQMFVLADYQNTLLRSSGEPDYVLAYKYFRQCCGDDYDLVTFIIDTQSGIGTFRTFGDTVYNNVKGISHWRGDNYDVRSTYGTTRLLGYEVFYPPNNTFRWFRLMETGHIWAACVVFKNDPQDSDHTDLLMDYAHWGERISCDTPFLSAMRTQPLTYLDSHQRINGLDIFAERGINNDEFVYSDLDLYLMGMLPPAHVPPFYYIENFTWQKIGPQWYWTGIRRNLTLDNIKWAQKTDANPSGERIPHASDSPRSFRQAFIVLTKDINSGKALAQTVDNERLAHNLEFRMATKSCGLIDTYLYNTSYDGIYIRDTPSDAGLDNDQDLNVPAPAEPFWDSPDIWVRNQDDGVEAHQPPIQGYDNWIYVRVRNRGPQTGEITVNVFRAQFAGTEFLYPEDWRQQDLVGSLTRPSIPANSHITLKYRWPANLIPASDWHPCLLAEILPLHRVKQKLRHVWDDRRIAQKNITVIDWPIDPQPIIFPFSIGSRSLPARLVQLRVHQKEGLPIGKLVIELSIEVWLRRFKNIFPLETDVTGGTFANSSVIIPHPLEGAVVTLPLAQGERRPVALTIIPNREAMSTSAQIEITQLNDENRIVGGLNLNILPRVRRRNAHA